MIDQVLIAVCGVSAVFLSQSPNERARRWAPVFGLCAQPAWLYATWHAGQWGIFALSFLYAASWARGIHTHWIKHHA